MNLLKEAQSYIGFATYCPLLYKATTDDSTATPGYVYEEIIQISFLSGLHRINLVEFLLAKLQNSRWSGKQKVIRILLQLSQRGHYGIRVLLRQKDGELRKAASQGGAPDPVLANTPQLFFNSAVQELLVYLFDPAVMKSDDEKLRLGENDEIQKLHGGTGYGSAAQSSSGKYEGFGNTQAVKQEGIVSQMYEMMGKVVSASSERKREEELKHILTSDKGNYQPLPPSHVSHLSSLPTSQFASSRLHLSGGPPLYTSTVLSRGAAHVAGKVGGGWASDEEAEDNLPLQQMALNESLEPLRTENDPSDEEDFITRLLATHPSWPVSYELFLTTACQARHLNAEVLLSGLKRKVDKIIAVAGSIDLETSKHNAEQETRLNYGTNYCSPICELADNDTNIIIILLFIEYSYYKAWLHPFIIHSNCEDWLIRLSEDTVIHESVRTKARKVAIILKAYVAKYHYIK